MILSCYLSFTEMKIFFVMWKSHRGIQKLFTNYFDK
uniref:Uncharacterized protein n=1 Tax=Rhizophora mucronata TaxID=61149 RepID=A0A2P2PY97_RHIMU